MTSPLKQVISGGQIGADIAGLRAASACGLLTGGWMPRGYRTTLGPLSPELVEQYGLQETESEGYPQRTQRNIQTADGTIQFAYNWGSPGELLTSRLVKENKQPNYRVSLTLSLNECSIAAEQVRVFGVAKWIQSCDIEILNVAGNANLAIEDCVEKFLGMVFQKLQQG